MTLSLERVFSSLPVEVPRELLNACAQVKPEQAVGFLRGAEHLLLKIVNEEALDKARTIVSIFEKKIAELKSMLPAQKDNTPQSAPQATLSYKRTQPEPLPSDALPPQKRKAEPVASTTDVNSENDVMERIYHKIVAIMIPRLAANPTAVAALNKAGVPLEDTEETIQEIQNKIDAFSFKKDEVHEAMNIVETESKGVLQQIAAGPIVRCLHNIRQSPSIVAVMNKAGIDFPSSITEENSHEALRAIAEKIRGTDDNAVTLKKIVAPYFEFLLADIDRLDSALGTGKK